MKKLERIEQEASKLSVNDLKLLVRRLQGAIIVYDVEAEEEARAKAPQTAEPHFNAQAGVTLKQEMVRCGKKNCQCVRGRLHGPYWYQYWNEGGRTRSKYVGKNLPEKGISNNGRSQLDTSHSVRTHTRSADPPLARGCDAESGHEKKEKWRLRKR